MEPEQRVKEVFQESIAVHTEAAELLGISISRAAEILAGSLLSDRKMLICGNGGAAACAQHLAAIMLNRLDLERPGLPAIALTPDSVTLTSIAEDYQFADVFAKQVRALGGAGDILIALSVNGNSSNIVHALDAAHDRRMQIVMLSGQDGGRCRSLLQEEDIEICAPSWVAARILETHMLIIHSLCDLVDRHLLGQED